MRESGQRNYTIGDLTYAISHNEGLEKIKKIVEGIRIADLDKRSHDGDTALCIAAGMGHTEIVEQLLKAGADVNKVDIVGATPLYSAAHNGHENVVKLLLEDKRTDVNQSSTDIGTTPLHMAAYNGHENVVKHLLADVRLDPDKSRTDDGTTPLFLASYNGHEHVVNVLLEDKRTDVNQSRTYSGATPLYVAAQNDHAEIAELLLDRGADVDKVNKNGATPLYIAAQNGHTAIAKFLLKKGADVNKALCNGFAPLYFAAQNGHTVTAALLLFATKLSSIPDHRFSLPTTIDADPKIEQILKCYADNLFKDLRENLNLIARSEKAGLNLDEYNSLSFSRKWLNRFNLFQTTVTRNTTTNPINTYQIVLSALYDQFSRSKNIKELLETFTEKTSEANMSRFKLNDRQSLLTFLLPKQITNAGLNDEERKVSDTLSSPTIKKDLPAEALANIAEYIGAFSDRRLDYLLKAYFNGDEVQDLVTLATERSDPKSVTDVEDESFVSRVKAGNKQDKCCIVM